MRFFSQFANENRMFMASLTAAFVFHIVILCLRPYSQAAAQQPRPIQSIDVRLAHFSAAAPKQAQHSIESTLQAIANAPISEKLVSKQPEIAQNSHINHAEYIAALQEYLEDFGSKHYPNELHHKGNCQILLSIQANGQLREARIVRSSGNPILDKAAIDLVKKAAPFKPFPQEMTGEHVTLEFLRTWNFNA